MRSFGTGNQVKLPGPAPNMPNIYDFSTTYDEMYKDLLRKDSELYPFSNLHTVSDLHLFSLSLICLVKNKEAYCIAMSWCCKCQGGEVFTLAMSSRY